MMDRTDRHDRYFLRLISPSVLLYTEMITTGAILHGDRERFLKFDASEHPVALQLGGADAGDLAQCAEIAADYGYDEVNLNVGCPSDRVQNARFGACLMKEPEVVAEGVKAMRQAVDLPVTVKSRIGVDDQDLVGRLCTVYRNSRRHGLRYLYHSCPQGLVTWAQPKGKPGNSAVVLR